LPLSPVTEIVQISQQDNIKTLFLKVELFVTHIYTQTYWKSTAKIDKFSY
jgi:hypothetical protein